MEELINDNNQKEEDEEMKDKLSKISGSQIITNISINQSLTDSNKNNNLLNNKNQNEINTNFDNIELQKSIENHIIENLKQNSEIVGQNISRNNNKLINLTLKEENKTSYNKRLSKQNYSYLNRFIDYEKKRESKLTKMQNEKNENIERTLQKKPLISRKSVELISKLQLNDNILERMNDEEQKTKNKKEKLVQRLSIERERKKKELEKPNEYNIRTTKKDNKFDKIYK